MLSRIPTRAAVLAGVAVSLAAAGPAAAATSTQAADADVATTLTATLPSAALTFNLGPGNDSAPNQPLNVRSNDAWGLTIAADSSHLVKSAGVELVNPLKVAVDGGDPVAVPETAASFKTATDAEAQAAGDAGTDVDVDFSQAFSYSDAPGTYHSTITYSVTTVIA